MASILLVQRHQSPVWPGPCRPPGFGEQHQRQQPGDLAILQEDWKEPKGRSDGIGRQAGSPQIRYQDEYDD